MKNAETPPIIFTNVITNEAIDAVVEARTRNRDVLLVTYHGNIYESCTEFIACLRAIRNGHRHQCSSYESYMGNQNPCNSSATAGNSSTYTSHNFSNETKLPPQSDDDILFHCRARGIILSSTFIFIGRSSRKELLQFQNDVLHSGPKTCEEKNILTEALSFLSPLFPPPQYCDRYSWNKKQQPQDQGTLKQQTWLHFVRDANSLICNRIGATMPPSWWGEDPSIIPAVYLVTANGTLAPIYVGKTESRRHHAFGLGRRPQSEIFPSYYILQTLFDERVKRAKRVYKWCFYAKQEFLLIEKTNVLETVSVDLPVLSYAIPTDALSHIFDFLDLKEDIPKMELVSKSAQRVTQKLLTHRLRSLIKEIEYILPDEGMDEDTISDVDEDERVSRFTKIVRSINSKNSKLNSTRSLYPLKYRTTSLDSTRTASSFSSSCLSDISECIDDLDRTSLNFSSHSPPEGLQCGAELWMGWRYHMLTHVFMANTLLNRWQFIFEKRYKSIPSDFKQRMRNTKSFRQKMFELA